MIKIYICEDNKKQLSNIERIIYNYITIKNLDMEIELATTMPNEVLSRISDNCLDKYLFFLDVDLKDEVTGIKLALEIREKIKNATIAFVTTHSELAYVTFMYKVEAIDYILKDDTMHFESRIREVIDVVYQRDLNLSTISDTNYTIKDGDNLYVLDSNRTIYFASSTVPHKITVVLEDRILDFYGKIKDLPNLSEKFIRCHQSFVVNIDHIVKLDGKSRIVSMSNGDDCLVSIRYLKGLISALDSK